MNIYIELTKQFNQGKLRAILSSGQAVVMHKLAVMSKDGDWIVKEDEESLQHVLTVLEKQDARYRLGAPFDMRWLQEGWSSHFEFQYQQMRVRTDFVSRPPRISKQALADLWENAGEMDFPFVDAPNLAELKKTNREKDYAIIGELARIMESVEHGLLYSRSARELMELVNKHPDLVKKLYAKRPMLKTITTNLETCETALDKERRELMHANERRLQAYTQAAQAWVSAWPEIQKQTSGLPLTKAHAIITKTAQNILPFTVKPEKP